MPTIKHLLERCVASGVLLWLVASLPGCSSSDDRAAAESGDAAAPLSSSELADLSSMLQGFAESTEAMAIARSFPNPELPDGAQPFRTEPNQRYEQWTLSAMLQDGQTGDWHWTEQHFFRIAIAAFDRESNSSDWAFRDVMAERYTTYNFSAESGNTESSIQRRAMQLSDVTESLVYVNDSVASVENDGCDSRITLNGLHKSLTWIARECPTRVQIGETIFSSADSVFENGVGWMLHAYGQLPVAGGAVVLDQLEVTLADNAKLRVNRSRRRSGTGPVTVAASITRGGETRTLRDVLWLEEFASDGLYPTSVRIEVPNLSTVLNLDVPKNLANRTLGAGLGARHGVLISIDNAVLPGVITLQPRVLDAS